MSPAYFARPVTLSRASRRRVGAPDHRERFHRLLGGGDFELPDNFPAPGQLAIAGRAPAPIALGDHPRFDRQPVAGDFQLLGRQLQQHLAGPGGRGLERRPEEPGGAGAESAGIPGTARGVAQHHLDRGERHLQLLGRGLGQRGDHPLAQLDLAGEALDPAILAEQEEGVEVTRQLAALGLEPGRFAQGEQQRDPAAGELEEITAVELRETFRLPLRLLGVTVLVHRPAPFPAACRTAAMIRVWAPQRQRLSSSPALISRGEGSGFRRSRA